MLSPMMLSSILVSLCDIDYTVIQDRWYLEVVTHSSMFRCAMADSAMAVAESGITPLVETLQGVIKRYNQRRKRTYEKEV